MRPAQPGSSVSHQRVSSGTFGCLTKDATGRRYILSCAHVLSDESGEEGDAIVQPGTAFGGASPDDTVATLARCIPLNPGKCIGDAGIAEVLDISRVTDVVRYIDGPLAGTRSVKNVGVAVQKSGDATGHSTGVITGVKGTIGPYSANGVSGIKFTNALIATQMSASGDSGALMLDNQRFAVGLIFGGLELTGPKGDPIGVTWASPIRTVLRALNVDL